MDSGAIRRRLGPQHALTQLILLGVLLAHALMAYTAVTAATGVEFSSRVALSSSMEPAIERGDLLLFRKGGGGDPIRVIEVHEREMTAAAAESTS